MALDSTQEQPPAGCECMGCPYPINSIESRLMHGYVVLLVHDPSQEFVGPVKDAMLAIAVIVIIFVVLLISMDRVSSQQNDQWPKPRRPRVDS